MDSRVLRLFLTLAEERHFGRAAARSHIAQPALSQTIIGLETELGVRLFDRSTRRVEITEAGRRFTEHAQRIVSSVDHAVSDMRAFADGFTGRVSVGFVGTATYDVLPLLAHRVREDLPDIDLQLRGELLTPQLLDGLGTGAYDLVLIRPGLTDRPAPAVELEVLRTEKLVAVLPASSPHANASIVDLSDLADETFLTHPSQSRSTMHHRVLAACARAGFVPRTAEVSETATQVVSVAAGLGVALAPEAVRHLGLDGVVYRPLVAEETVQLSLARQKGDSTAAVDAVAELVRSVVRAHHRPGHTPGGDGPRGIAPVPRHHPG
ncbi:LysR family transcriptional regulator [Rhodococcus sp. BP-349]|uniref:LysR family transcriptional regulator n=1 Tax=unclassified Rhodococcus (in: high G+C Gram-positive bacteria) TaxID=192944 RepID=UPI001C9B8648|nr:MULTISPECIES: LysR family transcriptional regulator [unclassified Rhodococcus (in: high G+C Gram-positive bacteria)]MBY6537865.1 LysR family transcriptional regulator [Rhodococcus sp. BP-363]MBY6542202.1 LysR family transcriptional regulator [Rhodococcus sp. BP-369]MBY6561432.1 LysR family transcriptional regulator [Rhodococcus sp. BP-370]MBY6575724.1 LysR family transcriptional regulator [Rhodococcus sp. BP-364]MBY6585025.1 LysR family transcriptional regulator [Rhodococcus sp. BP-358]